MQREFRGHSLTPKTPKIKNHTMGIYPSFVMLELFSYLVYSSSTRNTAEVRG